MRTLFLILILIPIPAIAGMNKVQRRALHQTQDLLNSPEQRQKVIEKNPMAKEVDDKVSALAGSSETKNKMYNLASQLLQTLVQNGHGNPQELLQLLQEAQKNPKAFYDKYFTEDQKAQVRGIAEEIEGQRAGTKPNQ